MTTAESIEQAVAQLPPAELAKFRRWFAEFDADAWDTQIEADAAAGRLDALLDKITPENLPDEADIEWGKPAGSEIW